MRQRKSIRLTSYDYSQAGVYFVTLCCYQRKHLFGYINQDGWHAAPLAFRVEQCWSHLPNRFLRLCLHSSIIMPNHFHALVELQSVPDNHAVSLSQIVGCFKSITARLILPQRLWQRGYYEHVVRSEDDYQRIAEYIQNNRLNWQNDYFNTGS